jgi:hypothetical protein
MGRLLIGPGVLLILFPIIPLFVMKAPLTRSAVLLFAGSDIPDMGKDYEMKAGKVEPSGFMVFYPPPEC